MPNRQRRKRQLHVHIELLPMDFKTMLMLLMKSFKMILIMNLMHWRCSKNATLAAKRA
jgi:hypothetical protein